MTSGEFDNLHKNLADYEELINRFSGTADQAALLNKIRHESSLVSNVLSSIAIANNEDAMTDAVISLRNYQDGLKRIILNNSNSYSVQSSDKQTETRATEPSVVTGRERSIAPAPLISPSTLATIIPSASPSPPRQIVHTPFAPTNNPRVKKLQSPIPHRRLPPETTQQVAATPAAIKLSPDANNTLPSEAIPAPPILTSEQRGLLESSKRNLPPPPEPSIHSASPLRFGKILKVPAPRTTSSTATASKNDSAQVTKPNST
jgi:hypothetical protein